jgi:hypothetical protein
MVMETVFILVAALVAILILEFQANRPGSSDLIVFDDQTEQLIRH